MKPWDEPTIVAICWVLVGVTLVCIFAAKVALTIDARQWSHDAPAQTRPVRAGQR